MGRLAGVGLAAMVAVVVVLGLLASQGGAAQPHALTLQPVGSFSSPVFVTAPPADTHRLFVVQQGGTIRVLVDGVVQPTAFLDISSLVLAGGEQGLLSMAFAPDYETS